MCVAQIPTDNIVTQAATISGQRQICVLFHVSLLASCHRETPGANQRASSSPPFHHGDAERVKNRKHTLRRRHLPPCTGKWKQNGVISTKRCRDLVCLDHLVSKAGRLWPWCRCHRLLICSHPGSVLRTGGVLLRTQRTKAWQVRGSGDQRPNDWAAPLRLRFIR